MLWKAKAPVEDCRIGLDVWPKIKEDSPFKGAGLPVVEMPDGKIMSQSKAIWRYFARKAGMYPKDAMDAFEHDYIIDHFYDIFDTLSAPDLKAIGGASAAELQKEVDDNMGLARAFLKRIDPYVAKSTKFLMGDEPTFVDCVLVTFYTDFLTNPNRLVGKEKYAQVNKDFPAFETYAKRVKMWANEYYKQRAPSPF